MAVIRFWQEKLATIYPNKDKSPDYMMAHLYTSCSDLGRLLLRNELGSAADTAVIKAVSWLIALSTHFGIDFETALVRRFPSYCHYCLGRPCECDRTGKRARRNGRLISSSAVEEELEWKYKAIRNSNTEITFSWLLDQLSTIYPSNRALLTKGGQAYVVGKMLEEGGELHRAYSEYLLGDAKKKSDIEAEVADLAAWVMSCWDLDGAGKDLDAEFASEFLRGCYRCHNVPCNCPVYSITAGQEELIRSIGDYLRKAHAAGVKGPEIEDALASVDEAAAEPTAKAKLTLAEKAKKALALLKGVNEGAAAAEGIAKHLGDAIDGLEHLI